MNPYSVFNVLNPFSRKEKPTQIVVWGKDEDGDSQSICEFYLHEITDITTMALEDRCVAHVYLRKRQ